MADIEREFREVRNLRSASRRLLRADVAELKGDVADRGLARRALDRAREGATDLTDGALDYADRNPAKVGTGLALVVGGTLAWLFRDRLGDMLYDLLGPDENSDEGEHAELHTEHDRSANS